jgi:type I restriction enzyme, S subunit
VRNPTSEIISANPWLKGMPNHWNIGPIKYGFDILNGATPKSGNSEYWGGPIVWVTPVDLGNANEFEIYDSASLITNEGLNSCGTKLVPPGSIVISTRAPIGSIGIAGVELCTNQGCKSLVPKSDDVYSKYYAYCLQAFENILNVFGRGTTFMELPTESLASFIVPYPPVEIQKEIVGYLDSETRRISSLIELKTRLLDVLSELRRSEIDKEFFRFNSSNPTRLKFFLRTNPGKTVELSDEDDVSFLAMESISEVGDIDLTVKKQVKEVVSGYTYFEDGDVTIAKITPCFENGKGAHMRQLINGVGYGTTELIVLRPNVDDVDPDWLYYLTQTHRFRKKGEALMLGSGGQKRVHESYVNDFRINIPSIEEQKNTVKNIKKTLLSISKLTEHVEAEINILRELKAKTMTSAVLGHMKKTK